MTNPCVSCGACCSYFRVQFTKEDPHATPRELVQEFKDHRCMLGTEVKHRPKCIGLIGRVGKNATCSIYSQRPEPCRAFKASYEDGIHNSRCDDARKAHGLPRLRPSDWPPATVELHPNDPPQHP